ncbi:MAG: hypothetical protein RIT46_1737, partial [Pseudomonadota bacterium]
MRGFLVLNKTTLPIQIPRRYRQFHVRRRKARRGREPKGAEGP